MGTQDNKYKQAWEIVFLAGFVTTVILVIIYLFSGGHREEMLRLTTFVPFAIVIFFLSVCCIFVIAQFIGWAKKRITNKHSGISEVSEIIDKQKDRQISINISINSDDLMEIISILRSPSGMVKHKKQNKGKIKRDKS